MFRLAFALLILTVVLAPGAEAQTYTPGRTAAQQGLVQQQLQQQQQATIQLQQQINALPPSRNPAVQAQAQANQAQIRQLQQDNLTAQQQLLQQQSRTQAQPQNPSPAP